MSDVKRRIERLEQGRGAGDPVVICYIGDDPADEAQAARLREAQRMGHSVTRIVYPESTRELWDAL